jgi:1-acyl-sn-glycerol-3-phosphate acyltransferase
MAMGPIYLASLLKIPVVPVGVGMDNPHRLNTWDKFAIPRPLSRVRMVFGPKIHIPPKAGREKLEANRLSVQKLMNDLTDQAEGWAQSRLTVDGEQPFTRVRRSNKKNFPAKPKRLTETISIRSKRAA